MVMNVMHRTYDWNHGVSDMNHERRICFPMTPNLKSHYHNALGDCTKHSSDETTYSSSSFMLAASFSVFLQLAQYLLFNVVFASPCPRNP